MAWYEIVLAIIIAIACVLGALLAFDRDVFDIRREVPEEALPWPTVLDRAKPAPAAGILTILLCAVLALIFQFWAPWSLFYWLIPAGLLPSLVFFGLVAYRVLPVVRHARYIEARDLQDQASRAAQAIEHFEERRARALDKIGDLKKRIQELTGKTSDTTVLVDSLREDLNKLEEFEKLAERVCGALRVRETHLQCMRHLAKTIRNLPEGQASLPAITRVRNVPQARALRERCASALACLRECVDILERGKGSLNSAFRKSPVSQLADAQYDRLISTYQARVDVAQTALDRLDTFLIVSPDKEGGASLISVKVPEEVQQVFRSLAAPDDGQLYSLNQNLREQLGGMESFRIELEASDEAFVELQSLLGVSVKSTRDT